MSLRDVKRAMEVMIWFYQHFQDFSGLMEEERRKNEEESENESDSDSGEDSTDVKETLSDSEEDPIRYLNIAKNKLNGFQGKITCVLDGSRSVYSA